MASLVLTWNLLGSFGSAGMTIALADMTQSRVMKETKESSSRTSDGGNLPPLPAGGARRAAIKRAFTCDRHS